jgi:hypothetical protein
MMNLEVYEYVKAAARCMNMYRMYAKVGTKPMNARAKVANEKAMAHIEKIMQLTGMSYEDAREIVQERYEQVFC